MKFLDLAEECPSTAGVTLELRDANDTDFTDDGNENGKNRIDYRFFRSFASQTLDKEGRTGLDCPVEWSRLVLPPALVELEGVS